MRKFLIILVSAVVIAGATEIADGHQPNHGIAAGYFSARTAGMCSPSKRCDWYGLAHCYSRTRHTVRCHRDSVDYRTIFRFRHMCHADGIIDHNYRLTQLHSWCQ